MANGTGWLLEWTEGHQSTLHTQEFLYRDTALDMLKTFDDINERFPGPGAIVACVHRTQG